MHGRPRRDLCARMFRRRLYQLLKRHRRYKPNLEDYKRIRVSPELGRCYGATKDNHAKRENPIESSTRIVGEVSVCQQTPPVEQLIRRSARDTDAKNSQLRVKHHEPFPSIQSDLIVPHA